MTPSIELGRREFLVSAAAGAAAGAAVVGSTACVLGLEPTKVKVGVIGCGSVSHQYLPHLAKSPHVELVSACDIIPERANRQAERFKIPHRFPHIDDMLAGAKFDLLVNLTDMQEHERLNAQAVEAGKHVWSEKPMANSFAAGQELLASAAKKSVWVWGAPAMVVSPQFAFMAKSVAAGALGWPSPSN